MKTTLQQLVEKYNIPKAWLAKQCGFTRSQLANWVGQPDRYPIPANNKAIVQDKLREIGEVFRKIELK
jgi:hypothetical protein